MRPIEISKAVKPAVMFLISVLIFIFTDTLLWMPFLILAVFYSFVNFRKIDKSIGNVEMPNISPENFGKLDRYVVDSDDSFGLFIKLNAMTVFVDLREDKLLDQRKEFALFLYENKESLEKSLNDFLESNKEFMDKKLTYIGLHSKDVRQGEVFWEPEGYTILRELQFEKE